MMLTSIPELHGYSLPQATENRQKYIDWIESKKFLTKNYAFTIIDFSFILKYVQKYYRATFTHEQCKQVEDIFYENYTIYQDNNYYIRPEAQVFGYDAVSKMVDTFPWLDIHQDASCQDLFYQCIQCRFIKYPKLVKYIKSLMEKGELNYVK